MRTALFCKTFSLLLATAFLYGCTTIRIGQDFDLSAFNQNVEHRVSSKADIRAWLGIPSGIGTTIQTDGQRLEKWTYYYGRGKLPGLKDVQLRFLEIEFNNDGKVVSYNWTE